MSIISYKWLCFTKTIIYLYIVHMLSPFIYYLMHHDGCIYLCTIVWMTQSIINFACSKINFRPNGLVSNYARNGVANTKLELFLSSFELVVQNMFSVQSINQSIIFFFSELQYKIMLKNKYVHKTSTNDIWYYSSKIQGGVKTLYAPLLCLTYMNK